MEPVPSRSAKPLENKYLGMHVDDLKKIQGHFGVELPFITQALEDHDDWHIYNDMGDTPCIQCRKK